MTARPIPWETEQLAAELAELIRRKQDDAPFLDVLSDERFHSFEVGVALARHAAALQGVDASRCARLATAAGALCAGLFAEESVSQVSEEPGAVEEGERVRALVGNAVRLRGQGDGDLALALMTGHRQLPRGRGGELFRAQGLVHWEMTQLTEAVALLAVANVRFSDQRRAGEVLATRELRVLLHAEMGESWEALRLYASCRGTEPPTERPWLSARAALAAAFCHAERDTAGDRAALREALHRGNELAAVVTDERELLALTWLAARAKARLKSDARSAEELEALREPALLLLGWHDYALLTLDVFACRAGADHALDLNLLREELQPTAPTPETVGALFGFFQPGTGHAGLAWCEAGMIGRNLRSRSRASPRPGLRPLPFLVHWPRPHKVPNDPKPS